MVGKNLAKPKLPRTDEISPYLDNISFSGQNRKVYFEVYGCQMNVNDTEVVWGILQAADYIKTDSVAAADVILIVTCAIRDGAEQKIWSRLKQLAAMKRSRGKFSSQVKIGILGCMAERLKADIIEEQSLVDLVLGPDSYKDLPRLLYLTNESDQKAVNVLLSLDETYADVMPVRLNTDSVSAFISITRGCDNMCSYCIVPFTRGRERSRPVSSIQKEFEHLVSQGVKEVTLLGQNVNSFRDLSTDNELKLNQNPIKTVPGFKTVYKPKTGGGYRFGDLLDRLATTFPETRIRFTSPHPKDFPIEVLEIIAKHRNICNSLHIPVQSGSSTVLERMRRGYSREAYLDLITTVRQILPQVALSSDFICGFCDETDEEFAETISIMDTVKYHVAFMFAYSMREKTTAHRRYKDNVSKEVKADRLTQMIQIYRSNAELLFSKFLGKTELVLVEGPSKRSPDHLCGRNDANIKVIFPNVEIANGSSTKKGISPGDYVEVGINQSNSQVLKGNPICHSSIRQFSGIV